MEAALHQQLQSSTARSNSSVQSATVCQNQTRSENTSQYLHKWVLFMKICNIDQYALFYLYLGGCNNCFFQNTVEKSWKFGIIASRLKYCRDWLNLCSFLDLSNMKYLRTKSSEILHICLHYIFRQLIVGTVWKGGRRVLLCRSYREDRTWLQLRDWKINKAKSDTGYFFMSLLENEPMGFYKKKKENILY